MATIRKKPTVIIQNNIIKSKHTDTKTYQNTKRTQDMKQEQWIYKTARKPQKPVSPYPSIITLNINR